MFLFRDMLLAVMMAVYDSESSSARLALPLAACPFPVLSPLRADGAARWRCPS